MKVTVITTTVQFAKLEAEGIDVLARIETINRNRKKVQQQLLKLWDSYAKNPSKEIEAKIEVCMDVMRDYDEELDFLLDGLEDA